MTEGAPLQVLLVDDDDDLREAIAIGLRLADFDVVEAVDGHQAIKALGTRTIGVVVSDIRMPMLDGRQLLQRVKALDVDLPVILITGHGDIDQAVDAVRNGAYDFLAKPFASDRLADTVDRALDRRRLVLENRLLRAEVEAAGERPQLPLLGTSPAIQQLLHAIKQIGNADIDALVEGEGGSGKAAVAQMLHAADANRSGPIHTVDCDVFPGHLIEQALFGSDRAKGPQSNGLSSGPLATLGGGTLVLANVDHLPAAAQSRLLHFLQLRDTTTRPSAGAGQRMRIISTSAVSLSGKVDAGQFRPDLYYRLAPIRLDVPPLRARRQDVPTLFAHLMRASADRYQRPLPTVSDAILARLANHDWPGNLRELQNFADQVILNVEKAEANLFGDHSSLAQRVAQFEEDTIRAALSKESGDIRKTCDRLSIPRKTLYDKIGKYGIDLIPFRTPQTQQHW